MSEAIAYDRYTPPAGRPAGHDELASVAPDALYEMLAQDAVDRFDAASGQPARIHDVLDTPIFLIHFPLLTPVPGHTLSAEQEEYNARIQHARESFLLGVAELTNDESTLTGPADENDGFMSPYDMTSRTVTDFGSRSLVERSHRYETTGELFGYTYEAVPAQAPRHLRLAPKVLEMAARS
jgi:hypothetical protein